MRTVARIACIDDNNPTEVIRITTSEAITLGGEALDGLGDVVHIIRHPITKSTMIPKVVFVDDKNPTKTIYLTTQEANLIGGIGIHDIDNVVLLHLPISE